MAASMKNRSVGKPKPISGTLIKGRSTKKAALSAVDTVIKMPNPSTSLAPQAKQIGQRVKKSSTVARVEPNVPQSDKDLVLRARKGLGVTQEIFARMIGVSGRSIAGWETGSALKQESCRRRILEMIRLGTSLREVMRPGFVSQWLVQPNQELRGLSPIQVLECGETDRLWRTVFLLGSGLPI